jgi:hypothetical protein
VGVDAFSPVRGRRRLPPVWSVGVSVSPPLVGAAVAMVHFGAAVSVQRVWLARLAAHRLTGLAGPKSAASTVEPPLESLPQRAYRQVHDTTLSSLQRDFADEPTCIVARSPAGLSSGGPTCRTRTIIPAEIDALGRFPCRRASRLARHGRLRRTRLRRG